MMEWRMNRGDAVVDAEAAGWTKYRIKTTKREAWQGKTDTWYKAEKKGKQSEWRKDK